MRKILRQAAWAAGLLGALVLGGCVVAPMDDGYADYGYSSTTVYTNYGYPPPPRVEYRSVAPAPGYAWVGGDWYWGGSRYDWRPGRWAVPGYRAAPPPHRPMMLPPPRPDRPMVRPDQRPRPSQFSPGQRPPPSQFNPGQRPPPPQARPDGGARPPQVRPDRPMPGPQMQPDRPRPENARPSRGEGAERRQPFRNRDQRDEERRQP